MKNLQIKDWLMKANFSARSADTGINPSDFPHGAIFAEIPKTIDGMEMLILIDRYTHGNNGVSVVSDSGGSYVGITPETLNEVRTHLRTNKQIKFASVAEAEAAYSR
jgi:hypothetical protein